MNLIVKVYHKQLSKRSMLGCHSDIPHYRLSKLLNNSGCEQSSQREELKVFTEERSPSPDSTVLTYFEISTEQINISLNSFLQSYQLSIYVSMIFPAVLNSNSRECNGGSSEKSLFSKWFLGKFTFGPRLALPVHWLGGIILKPEYESHIMVALAISRHLTGQHSSHPLQSKHRGDGNWNWEGLQY